MFTARAGRGRWPIRSSWALTSSSSDQAQLAPLLDGIRANLGTNPDEVSADAGYCSAPNLRRIEGYIATDRSTAPSPLPGKRLQEPDR
jgi:hypothetical protein